MKLVEVIQGTPEWHSFRALGVGGSESATLDQPNSNPYSTPRKLALTKQGLYKEDISDKEFIFQKGHDTETIIRKNFSELTGSEMLPVCGIHDKFDHIRNSFDGLDTRKFGVLEGKLVGKAVLEEARDEGTIPRHHWVQIQHAMEVANVDLGQWYGHNGNNNGILIEIKRDQKFMTEHLQRIHDFWGLVKEGKLPPLSNEDELIPADLTLLAELYDAKVFLDNAQEQFDQLKAKLDSYGHPKLRGAGIVASKTSRQGNLDIKSIPGVKSLLESYTEKYIEKHRKPPSKPSWTVSMEKKAK